MCLRAKEKNGHPNAQGKAGYVVLVKIFGPCPPHLGRVSKYRTPNKEEAGLLYRTKKPKTPYLEGDLGDKSSFLGAEWIPDDSCPLVGCLQGGLETRHVWYY